MNNAYSVVFKVASTLRTESFRTEREGKSETCTVTGTGNLAKDFVAEWLCHNGA
jgi:hypothetical protein